MVTKEVWDTIYEGFEGFNELDQAFYSRLIEIMTTYATRSQSILEVGSGSGYMVSYFQNMNIMSIGADRNIEPAKVAQRKFRVKNMVLCDMFYLPFKNNAFDIVWNEGVIEHFPYPRNTEACKEMKRVSRNYVVVVVPNRNPLWVLRKFILKIANKWKYGYEESYSVSRLKNLLQSADLKVEDVFGIRILPPIKEMKKPADIIALLALTLPLSLNRIKKLIQFSLPFESKHKLIAKTLGYAIIAIGKK